MSTCSASGYERNWSTFASIHTKNRNRLEHQKLSHLVYVKYNLTLRDRNIRRRDMIDPLVVGELDSNDEWITETKNPTLPTDTSWLDDEVLDVDAVREVLITTYENSVHIIQPSLPPCDPTLSLLLMILLLLVIFFPPPITYKRKYDESSSSRERKYKSLRKLIDDEEDERSSNPYDHTNPLFEDENVGSHDDSLDGDLLLDDEEDMEE
ncbi:hypothetical protein M0R45_015768 [Rubus argutus]|uniref:HAT C-terminal dimerisation domain-containing protein n=1 Tax=Rubus argutus TaxID=59490 RepID=A0AAW1XT19_RUBAR